MTHVPNLYDIGPVYVWQNLDTADVAHLNGQETTVTGPDERHWCDSHNCYHVWQPTSTRVFGGFMVAMAGELRRKDLPPGEQKLKDLIDDPYRLKEKEPA